MTTSFDNAAQVLTPPEPGLPYLRTDRAGELNLDPGGDHREQRRRPHRGARANRSRRPPRRRRPVARSSRGSSTATPTCRSRAGARRNTSRRSPASRTRRSRKPAAGSPPRQGRCARPPTKRCSSRHANWRGRCSSRARRRSSASPAMDSRARASCARSSWPPSWAGPSTSTTTRTALLAHAIPNGYTADSGWTRSRR